MIVATCGIGVSTAGLINSARNTPPALSDTNSYMSPPCRAACHPARADPNSAQAVATRFQGADIMRTAAVALAALLLLTAVGARPPTSWCRGRRATTPRRTRRSRRPSPPSSRRPASRSSSLFYPWQSSFRTSSRRRSRPASRPTSPSASGLAPISRGGRSRIGWWISRTPSGPSRTCSIRHQLDRAMLLNAKTGQRALYGLPMGQIMQLHPRLEEPVGAARASPSTTSPRSGRRSGRSGATGCSRRCARPLGRDDIWGIGLAMSAEADDTAGPVLPVRRTPTMRTT